MSASGTAHQKIVDLLTTYGAPSNSFENVYSKHAVANLTLPAISVEVESDAPITSDGAITNQELMDNILIVLSIRIHTAYRGGPVLPSSTVDLADEIETALRKNVSLTNSYHIFEVVGAVYNVEHESSGTTGAELMINIHKVVFNEQD